MAAQTIFENVAGKINLVFYEDGQYPEVWNGEETEQSPEVFKLVQNLQLFEVLEGSPYHKNSAWTTAQHINWLVKELLDSPLFGKGLYIGPNDYKEGAECQVSFHKEVSFEGKEGVRSKPVFFWNKDLKKKQENRELTNIIIRGARLVEGRWVVYYSRPDDANATLYGMLDAAFAMHVKICPPKSPLPREYDKVVGGPGLASAVEEAASTALYFKTLEELHGSNQAPAHSIDASRKE